MGARGGMNSSFGRGERICVAPATAGPNSIAATTKAPPGISRVWLVLHLGGSSARGAAVRVSSIKGGPASTRGPAALGDRPRRPCARVCLGGEGFKSRVQAARDRRSGCALVASSSCAHGPRPTMGLCQFELHPLFTAPLRLRDGTVQRRPESQGPVGQRIGCPGGGRAWARSKDRTAGRGRPVAPEQCGRLSCR